MTRKQSSNNNMGMQSLSHFNKPHLIDFITQSQYVGISHPHQSWYIGTSHRLSPNRSTLVHLSHRLYHTITVHWYISSTLSHNCGTLVHLTDFITQLRYIGTFHRFYDTIALHWYISLTLSHNRSTLVEARQTRFWSIYSLSSYNIESFRIESTQTQQPCHAPPCWLAIDWKMSLSMAKQISSNPCEDWS